MTDPDWMLRHYGRALDEIFLLRSALAYEAETLRNHLALASFPKSRRASAEEQIARMLASAKGGCATAYAEVGSWNLGRVRDHHRIRTLTRSQFEAEEAGTLRDQY